MANALNTDVSAFDFHILQSALRQVAREVREPTNLRQIAYQMATSLCPDHEYSEEMIDAKRALRQLPLPT